MKGRVIGELESGAQERQRARERSTRERKRERERTRQRRRLVAASSYIVHAWTFRSCTKHSERGRELARQKGES